jgi:hypothetical protein
VSGSLFERHPDDDVLADFAAEQLPQEQARDVETHVIDCPSCAQLLADAEQVRRLLHRGDHGPMPDGVWAGIETALAAESAATAGLASSPPTGSFAAMNRPDDDRAEDRAEDRADDDGVDDASARVDVTAGEDAPRDGRVPVPPPSMSFEEAPTAAWQRFLDEPPPPPIAPPVQVRVGRVVRSSIRSRRDVRTENRPAWRRLRERPRLAIAAAAAGVGILALGGIGVRSLIGSGSGTSVTDTIPGSTSGRSVVTRSGIDYTASTLAKQVPALLARETGAPATAPRPAGGARPAAGGTPSATAPGSATASNLASGVGSAKTVADPRQLASCLVGLGESGQAPVAVDLARYQGREAAIIVLQGKAGGHDVWVVARTCHLGAEGELAFKKLPA